MKKIFTLLSVLLLLVFLFTSCYRDNEYDLYPFASCDSTNATYSKTIAPITSANCNSCHSQALASGGVITDNYEGLRVIAADGRFWGVTNWEPGYLHMPQNAAQLPQCDLAKIKNWINSGFPNN